MRKTRAVRLRVIASRDARLLGATRSSAARRAVRIARDVAPLLDAHHALSAIRALIAIAIVCAPSRGMTFVTRPPIEYAYRAGPLMPIELPDARLPLRIRAILRDEIALVSVLVIAPRLRGHRSFLLVIVSVIAWKARVLVSFVVTVIDDLSVLDGHSCIEVLDLLRVSTTKGKDESYENECAHNLIIPFTYDVSKPSSPHTGPSRGDLLNLAPQTTLARVPFLVREAPNMRARERRTGQEISQSFF